MASGLALASPPGAASLGMESLLIRSAADVDGLQMLACSVCSAGFITEGRRHLSKLRWNHYSGGMRGPQLATTNGITVLTMTFIIAPLDVLDWRSAL